MSKYGIEFKFQEGEFERIEDIVIDADSKEDADQKAIQWLVDNYGVDPDDDGAGLGKGWYWFHNQQDGVCVSNVYLTTKIKDNFTEEELLVLLEAARIGLADAENFDKIAEQMASIHKDIPQQLDLSDDVLHPLVEKLQKFMNPEEVKS